MFLKKPLVTLCHQKVPIFGSFSDTFNHLPFCYETNILQFLLFTFSELLWNPSLLLICLLNTIFDIIALHCLQKTWYRLYTSAVGSFFYHVNPGAIDKCKDRVVFFSSYSSTGSEPLSDLVESVIDDNFSVLPCLARWSIQWFFCQFIFNKRFIIRCVLAECGNWMGW